MIVIQDINDRQFSFNGIVYYKNFTPIVRGDKTQIVNTYDSKIQLNDFTDYSEYTIDGNTYPSVTSLQFALLPVVYTRTSLASESAGAISWGNILGDIQNQADLENYIKLVAIDGGTP